MRYIAIDIHPSGTLIKDSHGAMIENIGMSSWKALACDKRRLLPADIYTTK